MEKLIKNPTIGDFNIIPSVVRWEELERVLGKRRNKKFMKWMSGQTVTEYGVFVDDLDRFLKGLPIID